MRQGLLGLMPVTEVRLPRGGCAAWRTRRSQKIKAGRRPIRDRGPWAGGAVAGVADRVMRGMAFGCSGCAEPGHYRWGLDQEQLASRCMGPGAPTEAW